MHHFKRRLSRNGFSLVEILFGTTAMALLLVLALTAGRSAIRAGQRSVSTNNLRQIGTAIQNFSTDQGGQIPTWYTVAQGGYWWEALTPYLQGQTSVFHSPLDTQFDPNDIGATISYGWNYLVVGRGLSPYDPPGTALDLMRLSQFRRPVQTLAVSDGPAQLSWGYIDPYGHSADPNRDGGRSLALFLDGSVLSVPAETLSGSGSTCYDRALVTQ